MRNVSGTARPAVVALACGLMFAAMLGAISATDRPTAAQMDSPRFSPNTGYPSAAWPGSPDPAVGDGVAAICSSSAVLRSHSVPPTEAGTEGAKDTKTSTPPGMYGARGPYFWGSGAGGPRLPGLLATKHRLPGLGGHKHRLSGPGASSPLRPRPLLDV